MEEKLDLSICRHCSFWDNLEALGDFGPCSSYVNPLGLGVGVAYLRTFGGALGFGLFNMGSEQFPTTQSIPTVLPSLVPLSNC